jgi:hypothetical protein
MKIPTTLFLMITLIAGLFDCAQPAQAGIEVDGQGNGSTNKISKITAKPNPFQKTPSRKIKLAKRVQR